MEKLVDPRLTAFFPIAAQTEAAEWSVVSERVTAIHAHCSRPQLADQPPDPAFVAGLERFGQVVLSGMGERQLLSDLGRDFDPDPPFTADLL